jgi:ABC-type glycerol-3-phosphate transport system permease component
MAIAGPEPAVRAALARPRAGASAWNRHRLLDVVASALTYLGLAAALVFFLGPFFWIVTTSLKGNEDFFSFPPVWIPSEPSLTHYVGLFTRSSGARYFANSMVISTLSMFAALVVSTPTAYAIARWRFGGGFLSVFSSSCACCPPSPSSSRSTSCTRRSGSPTATWGS